jgi:methyl-accepting chemotaxis protein
MRNVTFHPVMADVLDRFTPFAVGWVVFGIIGSLVIFVLIGAAKKTWTESFGKTRPLEDQLSKHSSVLEDLKKSLTGLAPKEKLDELMERLSSFATRDEFLVLEIIIQTFITRKEMEDRFSMFQKQIDDMAAEWRDGIKELRDSVQTISAGNETRGNLLHTLDERSKHSMEKVESLERKFDRVDTKIDRLIERSAPSPLP